MNLAQEIIDKAVDGGYNKYIIPTLTFLRKDARVVDVSNFEIFDEDHISYECSWFDSLGDPVMGEDNLDHYRVIFSQHDFVKAFFGRRWKRHLQKMVLEEDWINYLTKYL